MTLKKQNLEFFKYFLILHDNFVILKKVACKNIDSVQNSAIFKIDCQTPKNALWFPGTGPLWLNSYSCKWPRDVLYIVLGYNFMILHGKKGGFDLVIWVLGAKTVHLATLWIQAIIFSTYSHIPNRRPGLFINFREKILRDELIPACRLLEFGQKLLQVL